MFPQKSQIIAEADPKTYPLGEQIARPSDGAALALVALNHTPVERRVYAAMLAALEHSPNSLTSPTSDFKPAPRVFTVRQVMELTDIANLSTVRRGLEGLVAKSSAERIGKSVAKGNGNAGSHLEDGNGGSGNGHDAGSAAREPGVGYRVRFPEEVIALREQEGTNTFARGIPGNGGDRSFERVIQRIVATKNLSRREAQVALCCVEGLTNAEIGSRLSVKEQTVKFHLRHVFLKVGVKRRAELISRLLL